MMFGVHVEVFLALVYAFFLVGVAISLELMGRRAHQRAEGYRSSGFTYFRALDYWECPAGHQLVQLHTDQAQGVKTYRAPRSACNSCPLKLNCTDSNEGRVLEMRLDTWIESELRRFHRGISFALLILATLLLVAESFRHPDLHDRAALIGVLLPLGFGQFKLLSSLRYRSGARRQA